jgi:hypothetical protein
VVRRLLPLVLEARPQADGLLDLPEIKKSFEIDPKNSWLIAAKEKNLPIFLFLIQEKFLKLGYFEELLLDQYTYFFHGQRLL